MTETKEVAEYTEEFKKLAAEHNLTPEQLDAIVVESAKELGYRAAQSLNDRN